MGLCNTSMYTIAVKRVPFHVHGNDWVSEGAVHGTLQPVNSYMPPTIHDGARTRQANNPWTAAVLCILVAI